MSITPEEVFLEKKQEELMEDVRINKIPNDVNEILYEVRGSKLYWSIIESTKEILNEIIENDQDGYEEQEIRMFKGLLEYLQYLLKEEEIEYLIPSWYSRKHLAFYLGIDKDSISDGAWIKIIEYFEKFLPDEISGVMEEVFKENEEEVMEIINNNFGF